MVRIALYQPDIPQNTGTILRLSACLGVGVDIIEPAGFPVTDKAFRRAGMDYLESVELCRHRSFAKFRDKLRNCPSGDSPPRLILLTTKGNIPYCDFSFRSDDVLMLGRETAGVPSEVHSLADASLLVPMQPGLRSINVAVVTAMVVGEALRQTCGFPNPLPLM